MKKSCFFASIFNNQDKLTGVLGKDIINFSPMRFKQIAGYVMLFAFIGFLVYKFIFFVSDQQDSGFITFLVVLILIILLLAIRKIITS